MTTGSLDGKNLLNVFRKVDGDESDLDTLFPPSSGRWAVFVNHSTLGWVLYYAIAGSWRLLQPAGAAPLNFTTAEQGTGTTWIDGKTIYQKTIDCGSGPNNTVKSVAHGIAAIDKVVGIDGVLTKTNDHQLLGQPNIVGGTIQSKLTVDATNVDVRVSGDATSYTAYVTLRYTKP